MNANAFLQPYDPQGSTAYRVTSKAIPTVFSTTGYKQRECRDDASMSLYVREKGWDLEEFV